MTEESTSDPLADVRHLYDGTNFQHCANCLKVFRKGEWVQAKDRRLVHVKACETHPDVIAAREAEKAATT